MYFLLQSILRYYFELGSISQLYDFAQRQKGLWPITLFVVISYLGKSQKTIHGGT